MGRRLLTQATERGVDKEERTTHGHTRSPSGRIVPCALDRITNTGLAQASFSTYFFHTDFSMTAPPNLIVVMMGLLSCLFLLVSLVVLVFRRLGRERHVWCHAVSGALRAGLTRRVRAAEPTQLANRTRRDRHARCSLELNRTDCRTTAAPLRRTDTTRVVRGTPAGGGETACTQWYDHCVWVRPLF